MIVDFHIHFDQVAGVFRLEYDGIKKVARSFDDPDHMVGVAERIFFPHFFAKFSREVLITDYYPSLLLLFGNHCFKKIFCKYKQNLVIKTATPEKNSNLS